MSTAARREGFAAIEQFGGALAQTLVLGGSEFVHLRTVFLHDEHARSFLFRDWLGQFHNGFIILSFDDVKPPGDFVQLRMETLTLLPSSGTFAA